LGKVEKDEGGRMKDESRKAGNGVSQTCVTEEKDEG
jgi:hypothetical protein